MTTTLVTGGNRGIGYAIVKVLSARLVSPTLIIGCRDIESGEESIKQLRTEGISVDLDVVRIDIEDDDSIREAVTSIGQKYGKLDFNNAARVTRPESDRLEDARRAANEVYNNGIASNEIVTRAFLPILRRSPNPRVIMVSSARGSIGLTAARELPRAAVVSYCVSKAALNMLMMHLQLEEEAKGGEDVMVEYWAVSPGHCRTAFNGFRGNKEPEEGAEVVARLLEAKRGEFSPGTFWQCEDGELKEVKW
ncbi:hypothetical protein V2A60_001917 [Cordyceps javanica]